MENLTEAIKQYHAALLTVINLCESEIEKQFLIKILNYCYKRLDRFSINFIVEETEAYKANYKTPDDFGFLSGINIYQINLQSGMLIYPQLKVIYPDFGNNSIDRSHRLDFGIHCYYKEPNNVIKKYDLECDGFEYHSQKWAIIKDNLRLRNLLFSDYNTIRYSGSEIHQMNEDSIGFILYTLLKNIKN